MTHRNMTCDELEQALPDYFERSLTDSSLADVELHMAGCADCRELVRELQTITSAAAVLPGPQLSRDLWPGIEARIAAKVIPLAAPAAPAHRGWSRIRLGAVAAGLMAVTALATYQITARRHQGTVTAAVPAAADSPTVLAPETATVLTVPTTVPAPVERASADAVPVSAPTSGPVGIPEGQATLDSEISLLRRVLETSNTRLDPATRVVLSLSLRTIDSAIVEARRALANDPQSRFLAQHLNRSLEQKLGLLRKAALISPRA